MMYLDKEYFYELERSLPPIFTRETASKMIGGIFSPRTLSNFDSAGTGPRNKFNLGKKVGYRREEFIEWLEMMAGSRGRSGFGKY